MALKVKEDAILLNDHAVSISGAVINPDKNFEFASDLNLKPRLPRYSLNWSLYGYPCR